MNSISPDVWGQIEPSRPAGDELVARPAMPSLTPRLLAAVDSRGHRHLLIALNTDDDAYKDIGSRGISVATQDLSLAESVSGRYVNIACEDAAGHAMLDLIGGELAEKLRAAADTPAEMVSRVLAKWRRFWGQIPRQILTREAQLGLFAELWFLTYWMIPAVGVPSAVQSWRGPHGARNDFERRLLSIEAKGTTSARGRVFTINGIRQLELPESGRLLLFSLRLREEGGASNTLPMLVDAGRSRVAVDPDADGLFETALIASGYLMLHAEEYAKIRWRIVEELLFDVRQDFPRIVHDTFPSGPPAGVEEMSYLVNLGAFDHLIVARRPGDAIEVLQPS